MREYQSSLSSWDDFPVHQTAETVRHVASSDRNFYDRYYFNLHGSSDELFMVMGMGQYPNLATQDCFASVRRGDVQHVVRASRELGDRMDTSVGPFRVEVIEPLRKVRFVCDPSVQGSTEDGGSPLTIACDLVWDGAMEPFEEPRQYVRRKGRVFFDTMRFAQTGCWSGTLEVAGEHFDVTPDRWWGTRDRSWGVRPHGEKEPEGIHAGVGSMQGMWNYDPMQFSDHSILYMLNEEGDGTRVLEEAMRIWHDGEREPEWLGRPEYEHTLKPGTRFVTHSTIAFPEAPEGPLTIDVEPLLPSYIAIGTGYGVEDDWRHGMYQGPLAVQAREYKIAEIEPWAHFTIVDQVARFTQSTGTVGYGLHEHGFFGVFPKYGMNGPHDGAAA
ncbi:MAG TPA: hypothetical protein VGO03_02200 [Acidimicrobiia bacterium]|jgi:hypothetical protein